MSSVEAEETARRAGQVLVAALQLRPDVASDFNLSSFIGWAGAEDPALVRVVAEACHVTTHRDAPAVQGVPSFPTTLRLRDGSTLTLTERACQDVGCTRCGARGGYRFQWVGPWTCARSLGLSPQLARQTWATCDVCGSCLAARRPR